MTSSYTRRRRLYSDSSDSDSDEELRIVKEFRRKRQIGPLIDYRWPLSSTRTRESNNIAIHVTPPDGDEDDYDEFVPPLRPRRKLSTPLSALPGATAGLLASHTKDSKSDQEDSRSLSPLDRTKRRFSTMVSSAAAAAVSRRLSATIGWCLSAPAHVKPQIVRQGRALCLQYIRTQIRRAAIGNKKQLVMKRLQCMVETECGEEAATNVESGVLSGMRALCAALERKRPDAFRHVARQATRAPTAMLRSDTALAELSLALARRITRENITWSKAVTTPQDVLNLRCRPMISCGVVLCDGWAVWFATIRTPKSDAKQLAVFRWCVGVPIAAVYCVCGVLAREAAEAAEDVPALELVAAPAAAIADLLHEEPGNWIANHGGWIGLVERLKASDSDQQPEKMLRVMMAIFATACVAVLFLRWVLHAHNGV